MRLRSFVGLICISMLASCGNDKNTSISSSADTASTVAIYTLDETSGASADNSAQNRYHGTIYGASRVPGKIANALQFGTAGSHIEIPMLPSAMAFPNNEISIDSWVKLDSITPGAFYQLIGSGYWGMLSFCLGFDGGKMNFLLHDGSSWRPVIVSSQTLTTGAWHHVALTYDGATAKTYINGVADSSNAISYPVPTSYNPLYIGGSPYNFSYAFEFQGVIDEVRVFRVALSATQISDYYNLTK